jgi:IclR family acetate operon transcriptional repressor
MRNADWTTSVSVLDRITAVFEAFGEHGEGLGVSELARRANLPKSTVSRVAADLVEQRFLDRDGRKLYLGVRLFEFGQTVERPRKLREVALPLMHELRLATGRTVHLAVLEQTDVVLVAVVRARAESQPLGRVGERGPVHATALGKAMLAFSAHDVVDDVVLGELTEARTSRTATEREEWAPNRVSVASPVFGYGSVPVAAISVSGTVDDMDVVRFAPIVRAAAMNLSRRIVNG